MHHFDDRYCGSFKLFASDGTAIPHDQCWMALALKSERAFNGHEVVVERADGHRRKVVAYADPIHDIQGRLLGAVNVLLDISEPSDQASYEADRGRNEFLATLAHELRNPLAPIRNAVSLLHTEGLPTAEHDWALEVIDRQLSQMTRLIDDLFDMARLTGDKLQLRTAQVALAEVLRLALETSRPFIEACGQRFLVAVPSIPISIECDAPRLVQVVANLLENAAKYTPKGGSIWFSVERECDEILLKVRDDGVGIAAETLPRIFEMFSRGHGEVEQLQGGLGIGLTLVKRFVEMHRGSIVARSDGPDTGSEFIVRLPIICEPRPTAQELTGSSASQFRGLRIGVVDDNRDAATSLAMLLRIAGNEVRIAYDGREAVKLAESFRPDVLLLDLGLPVLDGYLAAQAIRAQPWGAALIIIATTGWNDESDRAHTKAVGFDEHLVKPIDHRLLKEIITSLCSPIP